MNSHPEIKYIGFYDVPGKFSPRVSSMAAVNKMDYVSDALNRLGYSVHLVSPSWFKPNSTGKKFDKGGSIILSPHKKLSLSPSFRPESKIIQYLNIIVSLTWLFFWLLSNVNRKETIIAYHSPWLSLPVRCAKLFKNFKIVLEVEEIYGDVNHINSCFKVLEHKLIAASDKYILSSELLRERIKVNRPSIILYGVYRKYETLNSPPNDGKIHLLYSGIIDFHKAGAFRALESALFLPQNYVFHLLGFGEVDALRKRMDEIRRLAKCEIFFEGEKTGKDFIAFGQGCHIGLSTQKMIGDYINSSFPSKILTYLSLGLRVVSCRIDCVTKSKVDRFMTYYQEDSPESIAYAIQGIDFNEEYDSSQLLNSLDREFINEIEWLLTEK